jgi:hypothetical protein
MWTWAVPAGHASWQGLVERVRRTLIEQHNVPASAVFYRQNIIRRWMGDVEASDRRVHPMPWAPTSLHADFLTDHLFVYTAILYLCTRGRDGLDGAETDIANEVGDDGLVSSGVRVEPSRGRLLVFSSGAENFHTALSILSGTRTVTQLWFACEGMKAGWADGLPDDGSIPFF